MKKVEVNGHMCWKIRQAKEGGEDQVSMVLARKMEDCMRDKLI
jgi:hypothetical protein